MRPPEERRTVRLRLTDAEPWDDDQERSMWFRFLGYTLLVGGLCVSAILWLDLLLEGM